MTHPRYLRSAPTLSVDNRDLASQAEGLTDEVRALRAALRETKAQLKAVSELLRQRDEQIAAWKDVEAR